MRNNRLHTPRLLKFPILQLADYEAFRDDSPKMVNILYVYNQNSDHYTSIVLPASVYLIATATKQFVNDVTLYCLYLFTARCTIIFHVLWEKCLYKIEEKDDQKGYQS